MVNFAGQVSQLIEILKCCSNRLIILHHIEMAVFIFAWYMYAACVALLCSISLHFAVFCITADNFAVFCRILVRFASPGADCGTFARLVTAPSFSGPGLHLAKNLKTWKMMKI